MRIVGIDAPESVDPWKPGETFGKEATGHLKMLTSDTALTGSLPGTDKIAR